MRSFTNFVLSEERDTINYFNDTLHPSFWEDFELKEDIRKKMLRIGKDISRDIGISEYVNDIQLTGSMANYNWTPFSDLDLHIVFDFSDISEEKNLVKQALDGKRFIWNTRHDIIIMGHDVELYFQDSDELHTASGLFSLQDNDWIRKPQSIKPDIDRHTVRKKVIAFTRIVELFEEKVDMSVNDLKKCEEYHKYGERLREKVKKMRRDSLEVDGEYGTGNLAFKELRNTGVIDRLINTTIKAYDSIFSD